MSPPLSITDKRWVHQVVKRLYNSVEQDDPPLQLHEVQWLIDKAQEVFQSQPMLLEVNPPLVICGDTHGQFSDLIRLLAKGRPPPRTRYLFLGDYVDRGPKSLETICLMFAYKILYSDNFFILRGNHESSSINKVYGFYDECLRRCNSISIWNRFNTCFDYMPLAALVGQRVFCMHGGISPELRHFDQIRNLRRPFQVPDKGMACDLLWADPDISVSGFRKSNRGVSYLFGEDQTTAFCEMLNIDMIIRAHQVVQAGYEFFANHHLMTVFSAPDYCNQFTNAAGLVFINKNLIMRVRTIKSKLAALDSPTNSFTSMTTGSSKKKRSIVA